MKDRSADSYAKVLMVAHENASEGGDYLELKRATEWMQETVLDVAQDNPNRPLYVLQLAVWYGAKYDISGDLKDYENTISNLLTAADIAKLESKLRLNALQEIKRRIYLRYEKTQSLSDLRKTLEPQKRLVDTLRIQGNVSEMEKETEDLATLHGMMYERSKRVDDLDVAICSFNILLSSVTNVGAQERSSGIAQLREKDRNAKDTHPPHRETILGQLYRFTLLKG